jgi:hypothetical protein
LLIFFGCQTAGILGKESENNRPFSRNSTCSLFIP